MKRIDLKPKRKPSEAVRLLRQIAKALTPPKVEEPERLPTPEQNLPGRCRSCGWVVPELHYACARCTTQTLRTTPEWLTATVIEQQKKANPDKTWPPPQRRYSLQDQIRSVFVGEPKHL